MKKTLGKPPYTNDTRRLISFIDSVAGHYAGSRVLHNKRQNQIMETITIGDEKLITPKELDEKKIISTVKQCTERKAGRLNCYRVGSRVLYSWQKHIEPYLASSGQQPNNDENTEGNKYAENL